MALTLINRSEHAERAVISLRHGFFAGPARLRCLTGTTAATRVSGVAGADLAEGTAAPAGSTLVLDLPDRSFTLIEAEISEG